MADSDPQNAAPTSALDADLADRPAPAIEPDRTLRLRPVPADSQNERNEGDWRERFKRTLEGLKRVLDSACHGLVDRDAVRLR